MRPLNHFEAVSVLREAEGDVSIRVYRELPAVGDTRQAGVQSFTHSWGLTEGDEKTLKQVRFVKKCHRTGLRLYGRLNESE